ncbi:conserved hypothetical protein [Neospora caninum Liverpool]|uniref:Uncharacterized protein n=1 Tax=Neospora caninum (strain Liverpool) TaxID=572307 RepID=F0VRC9_NEOCL|nr:conserved hypothetical protein [Neospora caninum Liverpool]CBZ56277.1 conserved hypothetical protein [Neospora caninum Liverpool]CEL71040.1 TPA: hypothetical protein BN1204_067020 [Neospora caninum Liverpool]|eukprot:XP_003886302.1 conserved hypothetical protein [Neospora caninum Liverpool]
MASGFLDPRNRPVASASYSLYIADGRSPISPCRGVAAAGHIPEHFQCTDVSTLSPSSCEATVAENPDAHSTSNSEDTLFATGDSRLPPFFGAQPVTAPRDEGRVAEESRSVSLTGGNPASPHSAFRQHLAVKNTDTGPVEKLRREERHFGTAFSESVGRVGGKDRDAALAVVLRAQMAADKRRDAEERAQREKAEVKARQLRLQQSLCHIEGLRKREAARSLDAQIQLSPPHMDRAAVARLSEANLRIPPPRVPCVGTHVPALPRGASRCTYLGEHNCHGNHAKKYKYEDRRRPLVLVATAMAATTHTGAFLDSGRKLTSRSAHLGGTPSRDQHAAVPRR